MVSSYLIAGENTKACESLAVLLRAQGHVVAVAPSATDAIQSLRATPVDTVFLVSRDTDVTAQRLRDRIQFERPGLRVIPVGGFLSGNATDRTLRWGIGDYRLDDNEMLALIGAGGGEEQASDSDRDEAGVEALSNVLDVLVGLRELNDPYYRASAQRNSVLAQAVAKEMGLSRDELRGVEYASLLRDIGKVEVEELLEETGKFAPVQHIRMQDHVTASVRLLEHIDFPWPVLPLIRHHHEHYDGTGYPDGLKAREIPMGARIISVVDAYVAMLSDRPHRQRLTSSAAQSELVRLTGKRFDPEIVEVLLKILREGTTALSSEKRPRLLISSSDLEFLKLIKFRLVNDGMDVDTVKSLQDGLLAILERPPSLVLASVGKDKTSTLNLLRQIREDRALRLLPIILLADSEDRVFKVRAFRLGADDYLTVDTSLEEIVARVGNILAREAVRGTDPAGPEQTGITGQLQNLPLPDIFQILNLGLKTARVTIENEEETGCIWFDSGESVHAEAGELNGEQAFYAMLRWTKGRFCIEHGCQPDERSIEMDTMLMVMDGLRLIDEASESARTDGHEETAEVAPA